MGELFTLLAERSGVAAPRRRVPDLLVEELGMLATLLPPHSFLRQLVLPRDLVLHLRRLAPVNNRRTRIALAYAPRPLLTTLDSILGPRLALAGGRVPLRR